MDVRVVGAGPAGLMAAEVLSRGGLSVTIVDHHRSPARKFLLAGRGGLNLTHSEPLDKLLSRYGDGRIFLEAAIQEFSPADVISWCEGLGVETFTGSSGRIFPKSMKASPILRAWLRRLGELGVTLKSKTAWTGFDDVPTLLALGGASWPELGSDAAWVKIFEAAGVRVNPLQPSNGRQLVTWSEHFATRFAGTPIKNVSVTARGRSVRGEIMITRDGLEGGAIYAVSRALRESGAKSLSLDLKPDMTAELVQQRLAWPRGKESRSNFLRKALALTPVGISLLREANTDDPKSLVIPLTGPAEIRRAISTAGGVAAEEVDENFRLRKFPSTYVVGEMLDWDAPTGGYLLQASFSTAVKAARAMVSDLHK
jgi:uncharacterized flavoprotein (TIGR03862 family)